VYENTDSQTKMVVTAGCGMHSIHIRINNPPEMVVIDVNKM
jgi:predicted MPP superfamily phosphohydrolase